MQLRSPSLRWLALVTPLLAAACGGSSSSADPGGGGAAVDEDAGATAEAGSDAEPVGDAAGDQGHAPPTIDFACPGGTIAPGHNEGWQAGGMARSFFADFPKDDSKPLAVVFSWHGFGDTADNFRNLLDPDALAGFPFVLVTPESTKLLPFSSPGGLEWELFASRKGDANREAALFESILGCLAAQKTIDPARIYSVGFSAGAIMTNQLHARYPGLLAASVAFSGAWFDDPAEVQGVNTLGVSVSFDWEPLDPSTVPGVLLTHGGATDQFGLGAGQTIIDFEKSAAAAVPFLTAAGRTVVECKHNGGHQPPSNLSMKTVVSYLAAHRAGEPSPYASGDLGAGWPSSCQVVR